MNSSNSEASNDRPEDSAAATEGPALAEGGSADVAVSRCAGIEVGTNAQLLDMLAGCKNWRYGA